MTAHTWSVRVRAAGQNEAVVHSGKRSFEVGPQVRFEPSDDKLTALEYFLGALSADIVSGFQTAAARNRVNIFDVELSASCQLDNPLVFLGVVGETGTPSVKKVAGTLYVSSDAKDEALNDVWDETLARSPLTCTLKNCVDLELRMNVI